MKALLFCAGLGTRLKPFTEKHPKALALVNGKTLLERNLEYLKSFGIYDIVINIHHFSDQVVEFLKKNNYFGLNIVISNENDKLLETGGGLLKAKEHFLKDDFLLMNVDILTQLNLNELIEFHKKNSPLVSLAVSDRESTRKLFFSENKLVGWKNYVNQESIFIEDFSENNSDPLAFSGIHLINPEIFDYITFNKGDKFSIMSLYMKLMENKTLLGFKHTNFLVDVGKPEAIMEAEKYFI